MCMLYAKRCEHHLFHAARSIYIFTLIFALEGLKIISIHVPEAM